MTRRYSDYINVRLSEKDMKRLFEISEEIDTPRSTIVRKVLRAWLATQEERKEPAA